MEAHAASKGFFERDGSARPPAGGRVADAAMVDSRDEACSSIGFLHDRAASCADRESALTVRYTE